MIDHNTVHIVPDGDLIEHETEINSTCACGPDLEAVKRPDGGVGWIYLHHALDGRELQAPAAGGDDHAPGM